MKWHDHYNQHLTTASEAVKAIKSGDRVVTAHACGEPKSLVEAMVDRRMNSSGSKLSTW